MKAKNLLLTLFIIVLCFSTYAQNPASSVTIPVQGIARDANNTARINTDVILTFEFYYLVSGTEFPIVSPIVQTLPTDAFGVFSTTLNLGGDKSFLMSNNQTYLRIQEGATVISNEILKHVPYAVTANNGVPTGSIMPFMGTTVPPGWLLCNGTAIPAGADFQPLRDVLAGPGATNVNTPNLQGMFLRGTGQYDGNRVGPALGAIQGDDNRSHNHYINLNTGYAGSHNHSHTDRANRPSPWTGVGGNTSVAYGNFYNDTTRATSSDGNHRHNVQGNSNASGGTETRPINFGVNYIIKL